MRITNQMQVAQAITNETQASAAIYTLSQEASSGLKISEPSDDPAGYAQLVNLQAQTSDIQAQGTAITQATSDLSLADGTLSSAVNLVVQAQQIALSASNGTDSAADRANAATQVTGIRSQLLALANTQGATGYLFGGTKTQTPPFDANGNFTGNGDATQITLNGATLQTNASGAQAFTAAGGSDVFADLANLATALNANDATGIQASVSTLQADHNQVVAAQVAAGTYSDQLQSTGTVLTNALASMNVQLSNEADANVANVYSSLSEAQTTYQAALGVTRQILSMTASSVQ